MWAIEMNSKGLEPVRNIVVNELFSVNSNLFLQIHIAFFNEQDLKFNFKRII